MILSLIKRHLTVYLRDRWAVFFSFLSVFIILMLFMVFLRSMVMNWYSDAIHQSLAEVVVNHWVLSGVLMVSTVTVPLGFLGIMVQDRETKAINDFYVAPVNRGHIVISYLISALIIGVILGMINLLIGQLYMRIVYGEFLPFFDWLRLLGLIVVSTALFSSIFFYVVTLLKTSNSHGTLSTLVGTLVGFLAGIYVIIGGLPSFTQTFLSMLPTMQMASAFRIVYMSDAISQIPAEAMNIEAFNLNMGVRIDLFGYSPALGGLIVMAFIWTAIFVTLSLLRVRKMKR